jgi:plasmid stabilization system protein ParE
MAGQGSRRSAGDCRLHLGPHPDAAQRLKDDIEAGAGKLPEHPKSYRRGRVEGTHEMLVRANYIVVYDEDPFTVRILRVLHAAQQWPADR